MAAKKKVAGLPSILAYNVRRLREKRGLSQQALADKAGVYQGSIAAVENEIRGVSMSMIAALAKALEVTGADLFKEIK